MGRLAGFKYREVARKLRTLGFAFDRPSPGSHQVWRDRETGRKVTPPIMRATWPQAHCAPSSAKPASTLRNS
jgi:predicted RNA binding protein YcfA (HicA-like mRNA interferase family)